MQPIDVLIMARRAPWQCGEVELMIYQKGATLQPDGSMRMTPTHVVTSFTLEKINPACVSVSAGPSLVISPHEAQLLIDDLWNAGLRPTEGSGSAGSLAATQRHLEDMRAFAFATHRTERPK